MKEEWTDKLRRKLDGHKMTPPAGLWEDISSEMGLEPAPVSKATIIRKWYWATAAVVLALVGFFAFYDFNDAEPQLEAKKEMTIKAPAPEKPKIADDEPTIADDEPTIAEEPTIPLKSKAPHTPLNPTKSSLLAMETPVETQQEAIVEAQQTTIEETNENEQASIEKKQTYLPDAVEPTTTASYSEESNSKWTIGLAGSNGLLLAANNYVSSTMSTPVYYDNIKGVYHDGGDYGFIPGNSNNPVPYTLDNLTIYTLTDFVSKHHIPVRFGLSLQYQLNNRLALLSGINYTYLKSEFSLPLYHVSYDQKLSYIGVPIGLSWKIWSTAHFNIYLAGGTMIEKCVNADITEGEIMTHPWQWSVNAAVGAEYNFIPQLGIYLEPSLGYYFDDGTKLEHYYKEHPLAPSLQFGLRLHLK